MSRAIRHGVISVIVVLAAAACATAPPVTPTEESAPPVAGARTAPPAVSPEPAAALPAEPAVESGSAQPAAIALAPADADTSFGRLDPDLRIAAPIRLHEPAPPPEPTVPSGVGVPVTGQAPPPTALAGRERVAGGATPVRLHEPVPSATEPRPAPPPTTPATVPIASGVAASPMRDPPPPAASPSGPPVSAVAAVTAPDSAPALPAVTEPPARQAAAAQPPSPAVTAPTPPSERWSERLATAVEGELRIVLPGGGWLYVGREYGNGDVTLLGKSSVNGDDEFRFRVGPGSYGLWFQQQDSRTGSLQNERLSIVAAGAEGADRIVVADLPDLTRPAVLPAPRSPPTGSTAPTDAAVPTTVTERSDAAVRAGATAPSGASAPDVSASPGAPPLPAAGATAGPPDDVTPGVPSAEAPEAMFDAAVAGDSVRGLRDAVARLEAAGEASAARVLAAARRADELRDSSEAAHYYGMVVRGESGLPEELLADDELLFRAASVLEQPGPSRDIRSSLRLYVMLLERHPFSPHWEPSRVRSEYLRRHYFEIR